MSLKTALLPGKAVAAFDAEIVGALKLKETAPKILVQERMTIGIRNEASVIYRCIGVTDISDWTGAIDGLLDLGFSDELKDSFDSKYGCDAIFSRKA